MAKMYPELVFDDGICWDVQEKPFLTVECMATAKLEDLIGLCK
ncbi:hypothetical protein [Acetatifactor muris]|nr:hypothetical protein [Acetatifactor muris]